MSEQRTLFEILIDGAMRRRERSGASAIPIERARLGDADVMIIRDGAGRVSMMHFAYQEAGVADEAVRPEPDSSGYQGMGPDDRAY